MTEHAARDVLLVRAIEAEDGAAAVLTREDRQHADAVALRESPLRDPSDRAATAAFLADRARVALERLDARYPKLQRVRILGRWPPWLNWFVPGGALAAGLVTNAIEGDRLNILAFPLLGMIAWNLAVYASLLISWTRRAARPRRGPDPAGPLLNWLLAPSAAQLAGHPTLERAVGRFGRDWVTAATPLTRARAHRTLHLSAAALAAGVLAGMFARARYTAEYTAGWAGTWAGAEAEIAALLKIVLGPASALTGISLPGVERLAQLRGAGENAGDWLILWMVTAALFVIVPRLLLALGSFVRAARLQRRMAIDDDLYVRRVCRNAAGHAPRVRVVPYGFELPGQEAGQLKALLAQVLGDKTVVEIDPPVAYGQEDQWLAAHESQIRGADQLILLFNLSSTPEAENHGAMASGLRQRLGTGLEVSVLLDDSAFMRRHRGQPSAPRRLEERLQAWKTVLAAAGMEPVLVSLGRVSDDRDALRKLEQALVPGAGR